MAGMSVRSFWAALAAGAAAGLILASPVAAAPAPAASFNIVSVAGDRTTQDAQEAADAKIVADARRGMQQGRGPGLEPFLPQLREILARAPSVYPQVEKRDNGEIIVRADNEPLYKAALAAFDKPTFRGNTYVEAAYLLGWYANEVQRPQDALEPLAKGLALQPGHPGLTNEQNVAMIGLGRLDEALAANDKAMAQPYISDEVRGTLLRNRGYIFYALNRFEEAEAVYVKLLEMLPGDPDILRALEVIRQKRASTSPSRSS